MRSGFDHAAAEGDASPSAGMPSEGKSSEPVPHPAALDRMASDGRGSAAVSRRARRRDDDVERPAPGSVIAAVALGVAPLPFLAVYTILFLAHGTVHPVVPPDIGNSQHAELVAGLVTLVAFVLMILTEFWLMDGRRRWPYLIAQLATFGVCLALLVDRTSGPASVPVVLLLTSLAGVVLSLLPASSRYLEFRLPARVRRLARLSS